MTSGSQRPPKEWGIKSAYRQNQQKSHIYNRLLKKKNSVTVAHAASYSI